MREVYLAVDVQVWTTQVNGCFSFSEMYPFLFFFFFSSQPEGICRLYIRNVLEIWGLCTFMYIYSTYASQAVIYQHFWTCTEISEWWMFREPDTCRAQKAFDLPSGWSRVDLSIYYKSELSWKNHTCCVHTIPCVNSYFWSRDPRQFYFRVASCKEIRPIVMLGSALSMNRIR